MLDAERIGAEYERVLSVVERVEEDLNRVGLGELGVAAALADDNPVRFESKLTTADIQVLLIEDEPDFGASVAGSPSFGSCWTNALNGSALAQLASSTRPSMTGPPPSAR